MRGEGAALNMCLQVTAVVCELVSAHVRQSFIGGEEALAECLDVSLADEVAAILVDELCDLSSHSLASSAWNDG